LLLDIDVDHHAVGRRAGLVGDLHGLEEIQKVFAQPRLKRLLWVNLIVQLGVTSAAGQGDREKS
jgi:hypothetical protein